MKHPPGNLAERSKSSCTYRSVIRPAIQDTKYTLKQTQTSTHTKHKKTPSRMEGIKTVIVMAC